MTGSDTDESVATASGSNNETSLEDITGPDSHVTESHVTDSRTLNFGLVNRYLLAGIVWPVISFIAVWALLLVFVAIVITPSAVVGAEQGLDLSSAVNNYLWAILALHSVTPQIGAATITLMPWGLTVIAAMVLFVVGRNLSRRVTGVLAQVLAGFIFVGLYTGSLTAAAAITQTVGLSFDPIRTFVTVGLVSTVSVAIGMVTGGYPTLFRPGRKLSGRKLSVPKPSGPKLSGPELLVFTTTRALAATFVVLGVASFILLFAFLASFSEVLQLFNDLNPGVSGFLALTVLSLGYLPVIVVWTLAYVVGAGVTIGPDVMVSPFIAVTAPTQLPPFPPLAVLPETSGALSWLLPSIIIVVGVVVGLNISRQLSNENALMRMVIGFAVASIAAMLVFVLAVWSSGNLGDVRLVGLGADPRLTGSLVWILLSIGLTPAALIPAQTLRDRKKKQRKAALAVAQDPEVAQS